MATIKEKVGVLIKETRRLKGFSQKQLAEAIGSEQEHISKLENGKVNPSLDYLEKIANALGRNISIFFENNSM